MCQLLRLTLRFSERGDYRQELSFQSSSGAIRDVDLWFISCVLRRVAVNPRNHLTSYPCPLVGLFQKVTTEQRNPDFQDVPPILWLHSLRVCECSLPWCACLLCTYVHIQGYNQGLITLCTVMVRMYFGETQQQQQRLNRYRLWRRL